MMKMKNIAIYGAGGFGREIACLIREVNEKEAKWNFIGFFDDGISKGCRNEYGEILGGINDLNSWANELDIVIAIGAPKVLFKVVSKITNEKVSFPNLIAPDVTFLDNQCVKMGKGNIVCSNCWISCNVTMGDFNILNVGVTVGHDSCLGNFNSLMPATRISGSVEVGDRNFFGVSAIVLQQIKIGYDTVIGAGSLILRKTKDGVTYIGNPGVKVDY